MECDRQVGSTLCQRLSLLSHNISILAPLFVPVFSALTQPPQKQNLRLTLGKSPVGPTNKAAGQLPEKEPGSKAARKYGSMEGSVSVPATLSTGWWFAAALSSQETEELIPEAGRIGPH